MQSQAEETTVIHHKTNPPPTGTLETQWISLDSVNTFCTLFGARSYVLGARAVNRFK